MVWVVSYITAHRQNCVKSFHYFAAHFLNYEKSSRKIKSRFINIEVTKVAVIMKINRSTINITLMAIRQLMAMDCEK